jgi:hypothetical protein
MPRQPLPSRLVNSGPFILLTFLAGTVVPAGAFLLSSTVRSWIDNHGLAVFWTALAVTGVLAMSLELQRRQVSPDDRDVNVMGRFRDEFGADSELVTWVRNEFAPNRFSETRWHRLEDLHLQWADDPSRRFRDKQVQATYQAAMEALGKYISRTNKDVWSRAHREHDPGYLGIPPEWRDSSPELEQRWHTAVDDISVTRRCFLEKHTAFLKKAHDRGL